MTSAQKQECTWLSFPGYCWVFSNTVIFTDDHMVGAAKEALKRLRLKDAFQQLLKFSEEYPLLFFTSVAVILTTTFPITIFVLFVMCCVIFGFAGLMLIEGALITTGSLFICGFIGGLVVTLALAAASLVAGYYGVSYVANLF